MVFGGLICTAAYAVLAAQSNNFGGASLFQVLCTWGITSVVVAALFTLASKKRIQLCWQDVLLFAIIFRLIALFATPLLEDDYFRYLWDGWMVVNQGTPYGVAPATFFDSAAVPAAFEAILDGINYPDIPTVYGPTAQWLFAGAYIVDPSAIWPLQLCCALADLGIVVLLLRMVSLRWAFLYGWTFLLVKEFAFTAHVDVIGAFFLTASLYLRRHAPSQVPPWVLSIIVGVLLAAATGVKLFCLLAVPYLLQNDWRGWISFGHAAVALALPFGIVAAWWPQGLTAMGATWLFNAPVFLPLSYLINIEYFNLAKQIAAAVLAAIIVYGYLRTCGSAFLPLAHALRTPLPRVSVKAWVGTLSLAFCALFMLSPVFNPWYLVWWLPIACLHPTRMPWVCACVLMLSYITGLHTGIENLPVYGQPVTVVALEFGLIYWALIQDIRRPLSCNDARSD